MIQYKINKYVSIPYLIMDFFTLPHLVVVPPISAAVGGVETLPGVSLAPLSEPPAPAFQLAMFISPHKSSGGRGMGAVSSTHFICHTHILIIYISLIRKQVAVMKSS